MFDRCPALLQTGTMLAQNAGDAAGALGGLVCFGLMILVVIIATVFWIWMLIDAIRNPRLDDSQRLIWILVIVLTSWVGALIYFFVGRNSA